MVVNYMYRKTSYHDSSLTETLVNFITVKYNPSLISCNTVPFFSQAGIPSAESDTYARTFMDNRMQDPKERKFLMT